MSSLFLPPGARPKADPMALRMPVVLANTVLGIDHPFSFHVVDNATMLVPMVARTGGEPPLATLNAQLSPYVDFGTVDELVARFRARLTSIATKLAEDPDQAAMLERAAGLYTRNPVTGLAPFMIEDLFAERPAPEAAPDAEAPAPAPDEAREL